jgi:alpha-1,6-mannosyltransferase
MRAKSSASIFATLGLVAAGVGLEVIFRALGRWPNLDAHVPEAVGLLLLGGVFYLVGVYLVERFPLGPAALLVIVLGALGFRLAMLPHPPALSQDVYRYQWEGRVQRLHLNPYTVFPATPGLARLQNPRHPIEAGTHVSTLYPPLSEMAFAAVHTVAGYKRLFTGLDLATIGVLLGLLAALKQSLHRVLVYAWNPGVVVAFALCAHHDSLAIVALLLADLLIIQRKPKLSVTFLALSCLAKFFAVLLLPVFLKRSRLAYAGIFAGIVALGYLPYLRGGFRLFQGLSDFAIGWEGNDSLFRFLRLAGNSRPQAELVAAVIVLALVAVALKQRLTPLRASLFLLAGLLFISPNAFPWYFTWMIPFLCFYPEAPLLLMSVTCVLGYAPVVAYAAGQPYRDSPFILALEYAPVLAWLAWEAWRGFGNWKMEIRNSKLETRN